MANFDPPLPPLSLIVTKLVYLPPSPCHRPNSDKLFFHMDDLEINFGKSCWFIATRTEEHESDENFSCLWSSIWWKVFCMDINIHCSHEYVSNIKKHNAYQRKSYTARLSQDESQKDKNATKNTIVLSKSESQNQEFWHGHPSHEETAAFKR